MAETRNITGEYLNELWNVGAKHALYREDGKWYHQLRIFPAALFDANGYVIFETEDDYRRSPYLQIQQDLHVPNGISSIPGYLRITEGNRLQSISRGIKRIAEDPTAYHGTGSAEKGIGQAPKGRDVVGRNFVQTERIIRDTKVGAWVKYAHQYRCQICGQSIQLGPGGLYAEAHHIRPLGGGHNGPDVVENILCVCPNHHVLLDYGAIRIELYKLRTVEGHELNIDYIDYHNFHIYKGAG